MKNPFRKATKSEEAKNQLKLLKKKKKAVLKTKKKIATTMDWCDIEEVNNSYILVGKKKKHYVKGIKITPHDIYLDEPVEQERIINLLRMAHNKLPFKIYFSFPTVPIHVDDYKARLYQLEKEEEKNLRRKQMLMDDYNKLLDFEGMFEELEFMAFIRCEDEKTLEKQYSDLFSEFRGAGFEPKELKKKDYLNYISWLFENPLINSYYFSQGIFNAADEEYSLDESGENVVVQKALDIDYEDLLNVNFAEVLDDTKKKKSRYAPTSFIRYDNYMLLGERFMSAVLVTQLPPRYNLGLMCQFLNNPDIKVFITTEKYDLNLAKMLAKDRREKLDQYNKTTDPTLHMQLEQDLQSQQEYLEQTIADNDITLNYVLIFLICGDTKEEMFERKKDVVKLLQSSDFRVTSCNGMQEQALRLVCPVLLNGQLPKVIEDNYGIPLPSRSIAITYPYIFETLKDKKGFLFGFEEQNGGIILFDPFAYKNDKDQAKFHQRANGNMIIVGKSGFGKSVSMNLIVRDFIREDYNLVCIDPENKIFKLIRRYGGSTVNYGVENNIINQFDLLPLSTDEEEGEEGYNRQNAEAQMWDTNNAINKVIGDVNQVFTYLFNEHSDQESSILGDLIREAYHEVGIVPYNGKYPSFRSIPDSQMPTYSTVKRVLEKHLSEETDELKRNVYTSLSFKLNRICGEWGIYLDGHTSLKFNKNSEKKVVAFGTKQLINVSDKLRTALNHIIYTYAWSLCIDNEDYSAFVIDEAHVNILEGEIAALTAQFVRRARKYNTCVMLATQEPSDFADQKIITHGRAIFNNSAYKLVMHLDLDPVKKLSELVILNENELMRIIGFDQGSGLFICGDRRIPIKVWATEKELEEVS